MIEVTSSHSPFQAVAINAFNRWLEQNDVREVLPSQLEGFVFTAYLQGYFEGLSWAEEVSNS